MDTNIKQYNISKTEIDRRRKAFTSLIVSLLIFSTLFSIDLIIKNIRISIIVFTFLALILFLSRIMTFKFLKNLLKMEIMITDNYLLKIWNKTEVKCFFNEIKYIKIKKTSKGYNRAIEIFAKTKSNININGLDNFEKFEQELIKKIDNSKIKLVKEPLDFDHPFFYPIFGLLVSFLSIYGFRMLVGLDYQSIKIFYYTVLIFNFFISIYFFITKPLSKTFEKKKINPDYIFSVLIILISILLYFYIFNK